MINGKSKKKMLDLVLEFIGIYYDDDSWREARYVDKKVRSLPYEEIKEMYNNLYVILNW